MVPVIIPKHKDEVIHGKFFLNLNTMTNEYNTIGKNSNFMCSHMDSLIGVKRPMMPFCPDQSYRKWASEPVIMIKIMPITV